MVGLTLSCWQRLEMPQSGHSLQDCDHGPMRDQIVNELVVLLKEDNVVDRQQVANPPLSKLDSSLYPCPKTFQSAANSPREPPRAC
jgi:hypothetical protein